jgi:hypothetical protein
MNLRTETSHHDTSQDDEEKFGETMEAIFGEFKLNVKGEKEKDDR